MNETALIIAFILFILLLLIFVSFIRKTSMQDATMHSTRPPKGFPSLAKKGIFSPPISKTKIREKSAIEEKTFKLNRQNIHKIFQVINIIGFVLLFAPLPDGYKIFGLVMVFLSSAISKATAPPKKKTTHPKRNVPQKSQKPEKIRALTSQRKYREALQLLYADYNSNPQAPEDEIYKRALRYLETKNTSTIEAKRNLGLLFTLIKKKKSS